MAVKWTTEQVERLIALYEAYPALYDIKDDKYYNRDEKSKVYAEIAADLQISELDVSKKVKSLRTQYLREKRAVLSNKSGQGTDDNYDVKWPYFKKLKFLDKFTIVKDSQSNLKVDEEAIVVEPDEDEDVQGDSKDGTTEDIQLVRSTKRPIDSGKKSTLKQKKKKNTTDVDDLLEEAMTCLRKDDKPKSSNENEDDLFGKFIVSELKSIHDMHLKRQVKWKIQMAIHEGLSFVSSPPATPWLPVNSYNQPPPFYQSYNPRPDTAGGSSLSSVSQPCSPQSFTPVNQQANTARPSSRNSGTPVYPFSGYPESPSTVESDMN